MKKWYVHTFELLFTYYDQEFRLAEMMVLTPWNCNEIVDILLVTLLLAWFNLNPSMDE